VREAIAFLLLACACGAATWRPAGGSATRPLPDEPGRESPSAEGAGSARAPSSPAHGPGTDQGFAALEARAASLAPGMRLTAERENSGDRIELVRASEKDTCARVAFEASAPVVAKLLDSAGLPLAEMQAAATEGELGERGPVCIRKGDAISGVATGSAQVHWIAWALP
jgi:hypothetical protein